MTPANPLATPPTATPTVTPCETCHAPLAAEAVRRRATVDCDGKRCCGECVVPAPKDIDVSLHYCRRCGRELNATTFANGEAIRVGDASICMTCIERDREACRRKGLYHCDNCSREIPIAEIVAGRAVVIDKALICRKCRPRLPDPAGRREAGAGEPHPVGMRPRTAAAATPVKAPAPPVSAKATVPGSSQALPTFETAPHAAVASDRIEQRRTGPQAAAAAPTGDSTPATTEKGEQPSQTLSADLDLKAHTPMAERVDDDEPATPEIVEDAPPPLHESGQTRPQDATVPDLDADTVRDLLGEKRTPAMPPRNGRPISSRPRAVAAEPVAPAATAGDEPEPTDQPASEDGSTPRPFRDGVARRSPSGRLAAASAGAARRPRAYADETEGPFPDERAPSGTSMTVIGVMGGLVLILCILVLYLVLTRPGGDGGNDVVAANNAGVSEPTLQLLLEQMRDEQRRMLDHLDEQDDRIAVLESQIRALSKRIESGASGTGATNPPPDNSAADGGNDVAPPPDAVALLRERLNSPNPAERLDAVIDAYQRYERGVADRLRAMIADEREDRFVRVFAIETLAYFQDRAALDTLRQLAGLAADELVRDAAVLAVAALDGGDAPGN